MDYKKTERENEEEEEGKGKKHTRMKIVNLNDFKEVKTETDKVLKSIEHLKKKINTMKSENIMAHTEVDKYRKEVNTIKEQLGSIENDLGKQQGVYETMLAENKLVN